MSIVMSVDVNDRFIEATVQKAKNHGSGWISEVNFDPLTSTIEITIDPSYVGEGLFEKSRYTITRYGFARAIERITLADAPGVTNGLAASVTTSANTDDLAPLARSAADTILQVACIGKRVC